MANELALSAKALRLLRLLNLAPFGTDPWGTVTESLSSKVLSGQIAGGRKGDAFLKEVSSAFQEARVCRKLLEMSSSYLTFVEFKTLFKIKRK